MSSLGWPKRGFLSSVGLAPRTGTRDTLSRPVELAEAAVDPRTGGAVSVTTKATPDGKGGISHIKTYYWYMRPSGEQVSQVLFDIEFEPDEVNGVAADGSAIKTPWIVPRSVWVLGKPIFDAVDDSNLMLGDDKSDTAQGVMENINRAMRAVSAVNRAMRQGELPEVSMILDQSAVRDATGERLAVAGLSAKGGFNFSAADAGAAKLKDTLTVPATVARALMGFGVNTLDEHQRLLPEDYIQTTDPRTGKVFTMETAINDDHHPRSSTSIAPASQVGTESVAALPSLTNIAWTGDGKQSTLGNFDLLGADILGESHLTRMRALGLNNRVLHDVRKGNYSPVMDHLVEYALHERAHPLKKPPPLSEGGRMTMISLGGNNMEAIADGFGETVGGNSKVVYHEGLDKSGHTNKVGVIIDLGLHLSSRDDPNIFAAPDVVEHLKYCNDILITHGHLDHTDGLFAYMQYGYLRGKTVHATPEVIRTLREKIRTYPGIHKDDLPHFSKLVGEGWLHIKDKEGKTRLSVNYARNATPHTARATPFFIHGHYEGKWIGSYLNPGDSRFGAHNNDDYDGPPLDVDPLNKEFFTQSNRRLLQEVPGLDPSIADRGPTYFDLDITSILKQGWAPSEAEVEENLTEVGSWFSDKGIIMAMISTNENRYETALRVATRLHRDVTEFGANLKKAATTANVQGVNDQRLAPELGNNIQLYLDNVFEQRLTQKIERQTLRLEQASGEKKEKLADKLARNKARFEYFQELKQTVNPFRRYQKRQAMEQALQARFGREATLGSLEELDFDDLDEPLLSSMRVGRETQTSKEIMGMGASNTDARRFVLVTGTQNTNSEHDSTLTALSEGRSLMDGNPGNSHTARPIRPEDHVIVISQTAIPGNSGKQNEQVRKLVARGFMVVQALHDGFRMYNIGEERRMMITQRLTKLEKAYRIETDGSMIVSGMPIHAGGHNQEKDCRAWMDLVKADVTSPQHTADPQAVKRFNELCQNSDRRSMGRIVPNFEAVSIQAGDSLASTKITSVGRIMPSIIRIRLDRQKKKYHGGHIEATRIIRYDDTIGFLSNGLLATVTPNGQYETAFASIDVEKATKLWAARVYDTDPHPINRMPPREERPHRGADFPGSDFRHRLFGRDRPQSSVLSAA